MGNTIKLLLDKKVSAMADIYPRMFTSERCESFHIHWRNLRMIFNMEEFDTFCQGVMKGYSNWIANGRKLPEPNKSMPEYLYNKNISPIHGERPNDFCIEIQGDLPYMPKDMAHIHLKSLRLDVSHKEFVEIAEGFTKALKEFKKWRKNEQHRN